MFSGLSFVFGISFNFLFLAHLLIDVRQPVQREICGLLNNVNIPFDKIAENVRAIEEKLNQLKESEGLRENPPIVLYCRRGAFSKEAARILVTKCRFPRNKVVNLQGGLLAWSKTVDSKLPIY